MPTSSRPFAIVTGASSGIGLELARLLAEDGYDLLICAEDPELTDAATELAKEGVSVDTAVIDLASADGPDALYERIKADGRPVDIVALNAGIGAGGAFVTETDLADELEIIDLNVKSTVHLAKH